MLQNLALLLGLIGVGTLLGLFSGRLIWSRSKDFAAQRRALVLQDRELRATRAALESKIEEFDIERLVLSEERKAAETEREVSELRSIALEKALASAKEEALKHESAATSARAEKAVAEEKLDDELIRITALQSKLDELQNREVLVGQQSEIDAIVDAKVKAQNALADEMAQARRREDEIVTLKAELLQALEQTKEQTSQAEAQAAELATTKTQAARADNLERDLAEMVEKAALVDPLQARVDDLEAQMRSVAEASSELDSVLANLAVRDKLIADLRTRAAPESNMALAPAPLPSNTPLMKPTFARKSHDTRMSQPDNLRRIKGVSPKLEAKLHELGVFHFDQIASWSAEDVAWIDAQLEAFNSDATRGQWISQAKILDAGGETPFSARIAEEEAYRSA